MTFVVVGTGRCGTTWLSDVLTKAGCPTGHEDVFTPLGYTEMWWWQGEDGKTHNLKGDVSLYAVPALHLWDGPILHQVREPLACIGSLTGWALPSFPNMQGSGGEYVNRYLGWTCSDQITASARYWVQWNEMCERGRSYLRYRVEDAGPELLHDLLAFVGESLSLSTIQRAYRTVEPLSYRGHGRRAPVELDWSDIPDPERSQVKRLAERYGYEVDS